MKEVLDCCCGPKMFWFDPKDPRALFIDIRSESHKVFDRSMVAGYQEFSVSPDIVADFSNLPFPDESFSLVVFDPPHLKNCGSSGWMAKKYGKLIGDWRDTLSEGFSECFRVLKLSGTLIFKWNETDVPVSEILTLTDQKPLFGHKSGRLSKTHWIVFMKDAK